MMHFVEKFNEKFGLPDGKKDVLTGNDELINYRVNFIQEELDEFKLAMEQGDRVKAFDALLDIVYVAQGTALFMGIDGNMWINGYAAVHKANMSKVAVKSTSESKRGSAYDVIKPPGWIAPEFTLTKILFEADIERGGSDEEDNNI